MKNSQAVRWFAGFVLMVGGAWLLSASIGFCQKPVAKPDETKAFARLVTSYELARIHATAWETKEVDKILWETLFRELGAEARLDNSWSVKFIHDQPDQSFATEVLGKEAVDKANAVNESRLTDFERQAIKKLEQGEDDVLSRNSQGEVLYLRSIHAAKNCKVCHDLFQDRELEGCKISLRIQFGNP